MEPKRLDIIRTPKTDSTATPTREDIARSEAALRREFRNAIDRERERQIQDYGSDVDKYAQSGWLMWVMLREVPVIAKRILACHGSESDGQAQDALYDALARTAARTAADYDWNRDDAPRTLGYKA